MTILFFGIARDIVGSASLEAASLTSEIPETTEALKRVLVDRYPELGRLTSLAIAVNQNYSEADQVLRTGDEIALIPPVSGG